MFYSRFLLLTVSLIVFGVAVQAQKAAAPQKDLKLAGSWKLNLEKSKYAATTAPKNPVIHTWWWDGDALKHKVERLDDKGGVAGVGGQWTATFDAKDHLSGGEDKSRVSLKRIDAYHTEMTEGVPGEPQSHFQQEVSKDGKTLTITRKVDGKDGQDVMLHDRQ